MALTIEHLSNADLSQYDGRVKLSTSARFELVLARIKAALDWVAPQAEATRRRNIFNLMKLPFELRAKILEHVLDESTLMVYLKNSIGPGVRLPTVANAGDLQLRAEAILVTIQNTTFEVHSGPGNEGFQAWLTDIDFSKIEGSTNCTNGFDAVQKLSFPFFSRFPHRNPSITINKDIELMKTCNNLKTVTTNWNGTELVNFLNDIVRPKSVDQLRKEYRLEGMLELPKLESLTLQRFRVEYEAMAALKELAQWFENEYQQRGQMVKVIIQ